MRIGAIIARPRRLHIRARFVEHISSLRILRLGHNVRSLLVPSRVNDCRSIRADVLWSLHVFDDE